MLVELSYVLGGKGIIKVCVIWLGHGGEQILLGNLCLLFSVKFQMKSYAPSHTSHYYRSEAKGFD
jgi:hypothetical protein